LILYRLRLLESACARGGRGTGFGRDTHLLPEFCVCVHASQCMCTCDCAYVCVCTCACCFVYACARSRREPGRYRSAHILATNFAEVDARAVVNGADTGVRPRPPPLLPPTPPHAPRSPARVGVGARMRAERPLRHHRRTRVPRDDAAACVLLERGPHALERRARAHDASARSRAV
jgi:hypothetical protein